MKILKVEITARFELDVTGWYDSSDGHFTKKETLQKLEEDFSDIEVLVNHIPPTDFYVTVKEIKQ